MYKLNRCALGLKISDVTRSLTLPFLFSLSVLASSDAHAVREIGTGSDRFVGMSLVARISQEAGGDSLFTATTNDGSNLELNAGDGTFFEGGFSIDWRLFERPAFESEFAIGIKTSTKTISGGELSAQRFAFSGTQFYRFSSGIRFGAGFAVHVSPKVEASGNGFQTNSTSLGSAIGPNVVLDYVSSKGYGGGLRATVLSYSDGNNSFDATSIGLFVSYQYR